MILQPLHFYADNIECNSTAAYIEISTLIRTKGTSQFGETYNWECLLVHVGDYIMKANHKTEQTKPHNILSLTKVLSMLSLVELKHNQWKIMFIVGNESQFTYYTNITKTIISIC